MEFTDYLPKSLAPLRRDNDKPLNMEAPTYHDLSIEEMQTLEEQDFIEFKGENSFIHSPIQKDGIRYGYFRPSHHFKTGLINNQLAHSLRNKTCSILSVGAGAAYLERFLVKHYGVAADKFVLADIFPKQLPVGFKHLQFDMFKQWNLDTYFDQIWLPNSMIIPFEDRNVSRKKSIWLELLNESTKYITIGGQVRISYQGLEQQILQEAQQILNPKKVRLEVLNKVIVAEKMEKINLAAWETTS